MVPPRIAHRVRPFGLAVVLHEPVGPATLLPEAVAGLATHRTGRPLTVRPLVYGYIRLGPADAPDTGDCLTRELASYANREGLTLADVFTDRYEEGCDQLIRSAFVVMVESLKRPGVYGVLIPSLNHFSRFPGMCQAMRTLIELETGARVLVMDQPSEGRYDDYGRTTDAAGHDQTIAP
jgi:hypothetical protein